MTARAVWTIFYPVGPLQVSVFVGFSNTAANVNQPICVVNQNIKVVKIVDIVVGSVSPHGVDFPPHILVLLWPLVRQIDGSNGLIPKIACSYKAITFSFPSFGNGPLSDMLMGCCFPVHCINNAQI